MTILSLAQQYRDVFEYLHISSNNQTQRFMLKVFHNYSRNWLINLNSDRGLDPFEAKHTGPKSQPNDNRVGSGLWKENLQAVP